MKKKAKKIINLIYKELTDEECYQNIKKLHLESPELIMKPKEWKRRRLIEIKKEGKIWSR